MLMKLEAVLNDSISRHDGSRCHCRHGDSRFKVLEALQVENLHLLQKHNFFVKSMQLKHKQNRITPDATMEPPNHALTNFARDIGVDQTGNKRLLLHGTRDFHTGQAIAMEGFDNRVASSGLYGKGIYFTDQTCKSAQYATPKGLKEKTSEDMIGTILIASVAIGDPFHVQGPTRSYSRALAETIKYFIHKSVQDFRRAYYWELFGPRRPVRAVSSHS